MERNPKTHIASWRISARSHSDWDRWSTDSITAMSSSQDGISTDPRSSAPQGTVVQEDNLERPLGDVDICSANNSVFGLIHHRLILDFIPKCMLSKLQIVVLLEKGWLKISPELMGQGSLTSFGLNRQSDEQKAKCWSEHVATATASE